ncbi:alcohol dehydrogenase catalytic domain-containing protein [bacterium]|nr:alcohol dehydrogenase catalytic domain-containing protein [bacterium]
MKAAQFVGKPLFELNDIPEPECPPSGLLVRVDSAAICGTDLKIMKCQDVKIEKDEVTSMDIPRVTGHEFSGVVHQAGSEVHGFHCGDRVVIAPTVPCLNCVMCDRKYYEMCQNVQVIGYHRNGGFAELVKLDQDVLASGCVIKVPENVTLEAAALTEPLSCAINCLELSPVTKDGSILVMGAGPLGIIIADLAGYLGAKKIIICDISSEQLEKAKVCLDAITVNLKNEDIEERIDKLTSGIGVDLVVTACPAPQSQQMALKLVSKKGAVNFFGGLPRDHAIVPLNTNLIHYKEITVVGTHGSAPQHVAQAVKLQAESAVNLEKYIESSYRLNEINEALKIAQGTGRLKILIKPNE